jgi:hypothetical protein
VTAAVFAGAPAASVVVVVVVEFVAREFNVTSVSVVSERARDFEGDDARVCCRNAEAVRARCGGNEDDAALIVAFSFSVSVGAAEGAVMMKGQEDQD